MAELKNSQVALWNRQHAFRGGVGPEGTSLLHTPNMAAIYLASLLGPCSKILEVGSANGRDARYWASTHAHEVHCIDFSEVALVQMMSLADEQNITQLIIPHCHDVGCGELPSSLPNDLKYDAFYARSALHLGDQPMENLASNVTIRLKQNGIVLIEGKSPNDHKIKNSRPVESNLVVDKDGHLRRVWTPENILALAKKIGWEIQDVIEYVDQSFAGTSTMLRFVANCT